MEINCSLGEREFLNCSGYYTKAWTTHPMIRQYLHRPEVSPKIESELALMSAKGGMLGE